MPSFRFLRDNWIIFAFIGQLIFNYATTQVRITNLREDVERNNSRIVKLEEKSVSDALNTAEINSRLASIETSLIFIKEAVRDKYE